MLFSEEIDKGIAALIAQWNVAEERIKKAENIRDGEVVASAIFELRYAGRKIIDALQLTLGADLSKDQEAHSKVHAFVADATEDCVKAKHDAIDSVVTFITIYFNRIEKRMSLGSILRYFPDYLEQSGKIRGIQRKIENSRRNRLDSRDGIYDEIAKADYDHLLDLFDRIQMSADRIREEIRKEGVEKIVIRILAVIGALGGFAGVAALIRHW